MRLMRQIEPWPPQLTFLQRLEVLLHLVATNVGTYDGTAANRARDKASLVRELDGLYETLQKAIDQKKPK